MGDSRRPGEPNVLWEVKAIEKKKWQDPAKSGSCCTLKGLKGEKTQSTTGKKQAIY